MLVLSLFLLALPAQAVGPILTGVIRDKFGDPLSGASVTDGRSTQTTGTDGRYSFTETTPGTYTIIASKTNYISKSQPVSTLTNTGDVDLSLPYILSTSLSKRYISTASVSYTLTHTLVTPAPDPEVRSCAFSKDTATGQISAMTYISSSGGQATWTWSKTLALGSTEGNFNLEGWVQNCTTGANLDLHNAIKPYTVDNIAPLVDPNTITPSDNGNTIFMAQPLLARVTDPAGSGVDPASINFTLIDETTSTSSSYPSNSYSSLTGWAKSSAISLVDGHVYRITASASDFAGNLGSAAHSPLSEEGGFLKTTLSTNSTIATIPPTTCSVSDSVDLVDGKKTVTCQNVPLDLAATSLNIGGTRHADVSFIEQTAPLGTAVVKTTIGGLPFTEPAFLPDSTFTGSMRFDVAQANASPQTIQVGAATKILGTVTIKVPPTWSSSATIEMPAVTTTANSFACADPNPTNAFGITCVPDPLANRYMILLNESVGDVAAVASEFSTKYESETRYTYSSYLEGIAVYAPFPKISQILSDSRVNAIELPCIGDGGGIAATTQSSGTAAAAAGCGGGTGGPPGSNPWECKRKSHAPHPSTHNPYHINAKSETYCDYSPPSSATWKIEQRLYRSRWYGWELMETNHSVCPARTASPGQGQPNCWPKVMEAFVSYACVAGDYHHYRVEAFHLLTVGKENYYATSYYQTGPSYETPPNNPDYTCRS